MTDQKDTIIPEGVNPDGGEATPETTEDKFEVSKEKFEELQQLEKNRAIENKRKSEENSKIAAELKEYKAKEAEALEKDKLKKGKYEEVISEKDEKIKSLQEKADLYDDLISKQSKETAEKLDTLKETIGEDVLSEHNMFLEDLSDDKKIAYLERLAGDKPKDFSSKPSEDGVKKPESQSELDELRAKKKEGKLSPKEQVQYLTLLSKENSK